METVLRLERVWFQYPGQDRPVLRSVSLELGRGVAYGVVGPNGSGKTTLLKIVSLLLKPSKGRILYMGVDPWMDGVEKYRGRIVYVHEKPVILRGTVYDNIVVGLKLKNYASSTIRDRASRIARALGLEDVLHRNARSLSMGQAQLTAIARALVLDPQVLALDEPFSNLDREKRSMLSRLLLEIKKNKTILVSSHEEHLLSRLVDKILYIQDGAVKTLNKPANSS